MPTSRNLFTIINITFFFLVCKPQSTATADDSTEEGGTCSGTQTTTCYPPQLPFYFESSTSNVKIEAMDQGSSVFYLGGSAGIYPIVFTVDIDSGTIVWQAVFTASSVQGYSVTSLSYELTGSANDIACALSTTPLVVVILSNSGSSQESFQDTTTYTGKGSSSVASGGIYMMRFSGFGGIKMSTYDMIFLSMQNPNGSWQVVAFWDWQPVSALYYSDDSSSSQALAVIASENGIYFTGLVQDPELNTYFALYKYSLDSSYHLANEWCWAVQNDDSASIWKMRRISYYDNTAVTGSGNDVLSACSEFSSTNNVRFHFFFVNTTDGNEVDPPYHWDIDNDMNSCLDVRMINYTLGVSLTTDNSGNTWFCQITNWYSSTAAIFTCSTQESMLYTYTIFQGYALTDYGYYVGYFKDTSSSIYSGFLMSTNTTSACLTLTHTAMSVRTTSIASVTSISSLSMSYFTFTMSNQYEVSAVKSLKLVSIVNDCTDYISSTQMDFSTNVTSPIYYCLSSSTLYLQGTFGIPGYCYECNTLAPLGIRILTSFPTSHCITGYTYNDNTVFLSTYSTEESDVETYNIVVEGTDPMNNLQSETISISILDSKNCYCASLECDYMSLTLMTYISNTQIVSLNLMNETIGNTSCGSSFKTSCSSNGTYSPNNITYLSDSSLGLNQTFLNINTSDDTNLGYMNIACTTTLSSSKSVNNYCTKSFILDIVHSCTNSTITLSQNLFETTYDISQQSSIYFGHFTLTYAPSTCIPGNYIWKILSTSNSTNPFALNSYHNISVYTTSTSDVGIYYLYVQVDLTDSSGSIIYATTTSSFTVTITDQCASAIVTPSIISVSPYYIGDSAEQFQFYDWNISYTTVDCTPFTYDVTINNTDITLYSFIQYTSSSLSFVINSTDISDVGYYALGITGVLKTGREVPYSVILTLKNPCFSNSYDMTTISDQTYYLKNSTLLITVSFVSALSKYQSICGSFSYTTGVNCGSFSSTGYVSVASSTISVYNDGHITSSTGSLQPSMTCAITIGGYQGTYESNIQYTSFQITIIDPCIPSLVTPGSIYSNSSTAYFVSFTKQTIYFTSFTYLDTQQNDNKCGSIAYTLNYYDSENDGSAIFSLNKTSTSINVYTDDESLAGVYTVTIVGTLDYYNYSNSFDFTFTVCAIQIPSVGDSYYEITADPLMITIPSFIPYASSGCPTLTYTVYQDGEQTIDSSLFSLLYQTDSIILIVSTSDFDLQGTYYFKVTSTFEGSSYSITFNVNVICVTTSLTYNKIADIKIPYSDPPTRFYYDEYTQEPQCLNAVIYTSIMQSGYPLPDFIKLTQAKRFYTIAPTSKADIGLYVINLLASVRSQNGQVVTNNNMLWNLYVLENSTGTNDITVTNSQGSNDQSNDDTDIGPNDASINISQTLEASILSISSAGLTVIKFSPQISVPANYTSFDSSVLNISVIPSNDQINSKYYQLNWTIVSFNSSEMVVQINFQYPQYASGQQISAQFTNNSLFKEVLSQKKIRMDYEIYKSIPPEIGTDGIYL